MSRFSGKCDLCDHISMEKTYDKGSYLESNEDECFEIFKQKTGGVIYQLIPLKLTSCNIDAEIKKVNDEKVLSKIIHKEVHSDKRTKSGTREVVFHTYMYHGKEVKSLSEIDDYCTKKEIHFDTLLDLIPYYPYIIVIAYSSKDHEEIIISNKSYIDQQEEMYLKYGHNSKLVDMYREDLKEHYLEVARSDKYRKD